MKHKSLTRLAVAAMEQAVRKVIEDHRQRNRPLAVWHNGKVVMVSPWEVKMVRETPPKHSKREE